MKRVFVVLLFLSLEMVAVAMPLSINNKINYGKFNENYSNGSLYQYETGCQIGGIFFLNAGLLLEYYKYDKISIGVMIPEYDVVSDDKQQYTYGGYIGLGHGKKLGPHVIYRFKRVCTYRRTVLEYFSNPSGISWTEAEFSEKPAYDIAVGLHYKIPKTNILVTGDWTFVSKIWNTDRTMLTFGIGYEFNAGNIGKAN